MQVKLAPAYNELNYLHFGDSLELGHVLTDLRVDGICLKRDLVNEISRRGTNFGSLIEIVQRYGRCRAKKIDVGSLRRDFAKSIEARRQFRSLGCRGFSFRVIDQPEFSEPLREDVNLRIALVAGDSLYYPAKMKRYLRRTNNNHIFNGGFPSLAFALGRRSPAAWYIYTLQSDLVFSHPSHIRDHIRGWRKIIFSVVLGLASGQVSSVYLCRSEDVLRSCHSAHRRPQAVPESWAAIYDRTALEFGMSVVRVREPVNYQLFADQRAVYTSEFYEWPRKPEPNPANLRRGETV